MQNVFGEEEEPAVPREMAGASGYREPPPEVLVDPAVQTLHKIEQQVTMLEQQDGYSCKVNTTKLIRSRTLFWCSA